jgi:hypothetical protein
MPRWDEKFMKNQRLLVWGVVLGNEKRRRGIVAIPITNRGTIAKMVYAQVYVET